MIHEVCLPSSGTLLKICREQEDGTKVVLLTVEAVYLDMLLASSQNSSRQSRVNEDDRLWWLPAFTSLVNAKYNLDLTDTEGWLVARTVHQVADQLKKSFESMKRSLQQTAESIHSASLPTNERVSTSVSPPSEPVESFQNESVPNP